ncbi:MAG: SAM-dependent methyltransferase, partial [Pseudomonadota bacterium]
DASGFDVSGKRAVDLGASTGGFTQVLLEREATHVVAVDVGHGQMDPMLYSDRRLTLLERTNARDLTEAQIGRPDVVVSDMSFISLRLAAAPALGLAAPGANAVLLVKPQFEVGREGVGKGGIVTNEALTARTCDDLRNWFGELSGWRETHFLPSPVKGGDGNREFLLCGEKA